MALNRVISDDDYRSFEQETRRLVVARILKTTTSPELLYLNYKLMSIDPTGKVLCAWYQQLREMTDRLINLKSAGRSDAEVSAAFDRELSLWLGRAAADHRRIRRADENRNLSIGGETLVAISGTLSLKRPPAPASPARPMPATTELTRPFSSTLNGRAIKVTIVLDTAEIAMLNAPDGQRRTTLRIKVAGRNVSVDVATKSLRKAIATIAETGADKCVAIVQGKLERGDMVSEAGLVVQLKTPKTTSSSAQTF